MRESRLNKNGDQMSYRRIDKQSTPGLFKAQ